jgi:hypothetical protein
MLTIVNIPKTSFCRTCHDDPGQSAPREAAATRPRRFPTCTRACARCGVSVEGQEMTGLRARIRKVLLERERKEAAAREAIECLISRGPPAGSGISFDAWRTWHRHHFVACPASKGRLTCSNHRCRMGAACHELWALGLRGNRSPLPRKQRPVCGARNRQGKPCAVRVEPGKRRCRFHGGLSTGPRTAEGRARIAQAQRRRWRAYRDRRHGSSSS